MSNYRRRIMMAALGNIEPPSRDNLVTWSYLRNIIPSGMFIRKYMNEFKLYKNESPLTWGELYSVVPQGLYFSINDEKIVVNHSEEILDTLYPDSLVTIGDLRLIFPLGVKISADENSIFFTYDSSEQDNKDPQEYATLTDLYKIVPYGISFFVQRGKLVICGEDIITEIGEINDIKECRDNLPNIVKEIPTNFVKLREFFELIPSGVKITNEGSITYIEEEDYNNHKILTMSDFYNVFPNNIKFIIEDNKPKVEIINNPEIYTGNLTWGKLRKYIPNGVYFIRTPDEKYVPRYDKMKIRLYNGDNTSVTAKDISEILPFGVNINENGIGNKTIPYPILANDYNRAITKEMLHYFIPDGISFSFSSITGETHINV